MKNISIESAARTQISGADTGICAVTALTSLLLVVSACSSDEPERVEVVGERPAGAGERGANAKPSSTAGKPDFTGGGPIAQGRDGELPELLKGDLGVPADHEPTRGGDRQALAAVYISFAEDPEGFVEQVEKLPSSQRQRIAAFLFCAAPKLLAAGKGEPTAGGPVALELPAVADELIGFKGSPARMRSMFVRQLAGEFLIVGRSIQSIDRGQHQLVEEVLRSQQRNLEMMKASTGPTEAAKWGARIRRVFPELFDKLLPEC